MKYGYLKAKRLSEIEEFKVLANTDTVYCDLSGTVELEKLMDIMKNGDELVIKSLENATNSILDIKNNGMDDLCILISTCKEKGVNLVSLEEGDVVKVLITPNGLEVVQIIRKLIISKLTTELNKERKVGRPEADYPERFLEYYYAVQADKKDRKKPNRMNSKRAAQELGITLEIWYKLVKAFQTR